MQHAEQQRQVGAGARGQMQPRAVLGERRSCTPARVHHDQATPATHRSEVTHEGRHRLGGVAPEQEDGVRSAEIGQRKGQAAIEAEGAIGTGRGTRHTETTVVVDEARAQRQAREFAQLVGLFVGQPATAEDSNGVLAVLALHLSDGRGDVVEGNLPGHRDQLPAVAA